MWPGRLHLPQRSVSWLFCKKHVPLTAVLMGHPTQSAPQERRKPWGLMWVSKGHSLWKCPFSRNQQKFQVQRKACNEADLEARWGPGCSWSLKCQTWVPWSQPWPPLESGAWDGSRSPPRLPKDGVQRQPCGLPGSAVCLFSFDLKVWPQRRECEVLLFWP